ncbi:MAG: ATP-binding cassette domain-containing protein [Oscillospiraceae bacterium]|nr:ATP-binding cassette domain-containing protein [Oscillospiraceae bacterium]
MKPLGMGTAGHIATYGIGLVMLVITLLLGVYWNKKLPSTVKEEGWTTRVIAKIAILAAVAAAGGMITIPGPATSIRLDSLAGYFGTLMFGWQVGSVIAMFGTFFSNLMSGFSGGAALVPYYMINMAFAATAYGVASKKAGKIVGIVVGTFVNTLCILPWIVMLGWQMMVTTLVPQIVASCANCLLSTIAYTAITAARQRRKVEAPGEIPADEADDDDDDKDDDSDDAVVADAKDAPIIKFENVSFRYDKTKRKVLKNIDLEIKEGEFVVITGPTGAGKTTLCETLNGIIPNFVKGQLKGKITVDGKNPKKSKVAQMAQTVGLVFQDPDTQLFGMTVEEDVAFGATNLGYDYEECMRRVNRCVEDLNLHALIDRKPMELSGGQKQSVAIAGIYAMLPKIIVCDEPTSMLDPLGKRNIFALIKRLNKEYGITVVLVEHVMSEIVRHADKVVVMDKGSIVMQGSVEEVFSQTDRLNELGLNIPESIEASMKLKEAGYIDSVTLVSDELIEKLKDFKPKAGVELVRKPRALKPGGDETVIDVKNLTFSYLGDSKQLDDVSLQFKRGDFVAIIGQNGAGKTTLCRNIIGLLKSQSGSITVAGIDVATKSVAELSATVGYCFQNPDEQIFKDSVEDELFFGADNLGRTDEHTKERIAQIMEDVGLSEYKKVWPKYLSKGERQRLTIGSIIAMDPDVVIVDEPTTGQDWRETIWIMELLKKINDMGKTIIIITHNMEIVCRYCNRVLTMRHGKVLLDGTPAEVFAHPEELSSAYVQPTDITRIAQALDYMPNDVTSVDEFCDLFAQLMEKEG